jgi:phage-related baseplate assembly protein
MPLSLAQLKKGVTVDQALAAVVADLQSLGFVSDSWQAGAVQRNLLTAYATGYAGLSRVVRDLVLQILVNPSGEWQDLFGLRWYQLPRLEAVATERTIKIVSAASAPPYVVTDGSMVTTTDGTRVRYRVVGSHPVAAGATVTAIPVVAEFAGSAGNVPASTAMSPQVPTYSGLTVSLEGAPTVNGADRESDPRYQERLDRRWSEMTYSVGLRAYELWAMTAAPTVTRVRALNNYPDPNDVRIVLYPGEPSEIAQVEAYIASRHPPNDVVTVSAANVVPQSIVLNPRTYAGVTAAQVEAAVRRAVDAHPIGGYVVSGASAGRLLRERLSEALLCGGLAQTAGIDSPDDDVVLGATDVVAPTFTTTLERAV